MKPFEERLTAWIDDRLPAEEHAAFERELDARPADEAAAFRAEKRHVGQLRSLLRDHLQSPPLTSANFFNHGILERIAADAREEDHAAPVLASAPGWRRFFFGDSGGGLSPARLLAAGAACLLAGVVGIYALIPGAAPSRNAGGGIVEALPARAPEVRVAETTPTPLPPPAAPGPRSEDDGQFVLNDRPAPPVPLPPAPVPEAVPPPPAVATPAAPPEVPKTSATLLHFDEQNADVLWLDGWEYLPEVNAATLPAAAAATPPDAPKPQP